MASLIPGFRSSGPDQLGHARVVSTPSLLLAYVFLAGHSEDASRDSLIERLQALELIEPSFDVTQRQGVRLKQWVYVALILLYRA
jgi:hypothetical protein